MLIAPEPISETSSRADSVMFSFCVLRRFAWPLAVIALVCSEDGSLSRAVAHRADQRATPSPTIARQCVTKSRRLKNSPGLEVSSRSRLD